MIKDGKLSTMFSCEMTENMVCLWYSKTQKKIFDSHDNCMCSLFVNTLEYLENNLFCYHQKLCNVSKSFTITKYELKVAILFFFDAFPVGPLHKFLVKARILTINLELSFCCLWLCFNKGIYILYYNIYFWWDLFIRLINYLKWPH